MAAGGGVGALILPIFANGTGSLLSRGLIVVGGVGAAVLAAVFVASRRAGRGLAVFGGLLVIAAAVVLNATPLSPLTVFAAAGLGVGVGFSALRVGERDRIWLLGLLEALLALGLAAALGPDAAPFVVGGVLGILGAAAATVTEPGGTRRGARPVAAVAALTLAALVFWVGANDPAIAWFGPQRSHGPRNQRSVAITFDDGPNAGSTLRIAAILDAHHAKGAFFSVGKAVERRPDITRRLVADGHLLGNHSYEHDQWRWLDPRYPELDRAQRTYRRRVGVCPALYRPPHGERTWFISHLVAREHMQLVLWDASAGDWATTDEQLVARRILRKAKPGSIILLHDGLDGDVTANRTVVERALPLILDGLARRNMRVVRLDRLLGVKPYLSRC